MKQHITVKQLRGLSKEAKRKLRRWWTPCPGDVCFVAYLDEDNRPFFGDKGPDWLGSDVPRIIVVENYANNEIIKKKLFEWFPGESEPIYPLLSIGQMIEFLVNRKFYLTADYIGSNKTIISYYHSMSSQYPEVVCKSDFFSDTYRSCSLCDALWKVVKEKLNE